MVIYKMIDSYMLYIGDTRVAVYFCVHSVIYAYILELHMIVAFNIFSHFFFA